MSSFDAARVKLPSRATSAKAAIAGSKFRSIRPFYEVQLHID
jgi:hypothetical protein